MDQRNLEVTKDCTDKSDAECAGSRLYEAASDLGRLASAGIAGAAAGAQIGKLAADILPSFEIGKGLGGNLPGLDLTGFSQEAPYQSQGTLKDIWHGIKHAFAKDETLDDKIQQHCESKMSKEERQKFDAEEKAMSDYQKKVIAWGMGTMLPPPPFPKKPETPMHAEIERRAEALEKEITKSVRDNMSPSDLIRLDKSMGDYKRRVEESRTIRNPLGTGEGFRPMPTPGSTIQDYFLRVSEATEKYLQKS